MTRSIHDNLAKQRAANAAAASLLPETDLMSLCGPSALSAHQVALQLQPSKEQLTLHSAKELRPTELPHGLDSKHFLEGLRRKTLGDFEGALHAYNIADRIRPRHLPTMFNRAVTYQAIGRHAEAVVGFTEARESEFGL